MAANEKPGYQFLFQRLPIMVAALDERGFFIDQSDAMINRLGYSREELQSLRPTDIADKDSVRRINEEFIPQLRRTGSVRDVPVVFLDRNGEAVRLMTSADVERDAAGAYLRTLAIYRDMDEAAELEARYAAMYRATPAMLHIVDQKGRITDVSDRWLTKLGFERKDVLGKSILGFLSEDNRRAIGGQERLEYLIASGGVTNSEREMVTRDGRTLELMMSTLAERNAAGEVVRTLVASKDVTERNEAERALRRAFEENARLREELEAERDYLREEFNESLRFGEVVGSSPALRQMLARVEAVAATPASVLILGESGTGKELVARELHARSPRSGESLVKVNCASIPEELFESEFFGHVKGAFTGAHRDRIGRFQLADGGTIFLDEVGEIPLDLQGKLLRVLQENEFERVGEDYTRKVDVRVIAATNRDLEEAVRAGEFREDLFYRLSVFPLEVPPLRERGDDVVALAQHFLSQAARDFGRPVLQLTQRQAALLREYPWPGNIRELKNVIERAVILSRDAHLRLDLSLPPEELSGEIGFPTGASETTLALTPERDGDEVLSEREMRAFERENTVRALRATGWKVSGEGGAAERLGVKPSTLSDRIKTWGIERPRTRS
ncbi:MAG: sigma 54-interacting transcriptional regulator [Pseudomonadota bacterium]